MKKVFTTEYTTAEKSSEMAKRSVILFNFYCICEKNRVCYQMSKFNIGVKSKVFIFILSVLLMSQCASRQETVKGNLPTDIRGIKLNMSKEDAHKRIKEIAKLKEEAERGQEVWTLTNDPNFNYLILGYDKEDKVKFITTILEKTSVGSKDRIKFADIGDLSKAKKESVGNINKYIWNVEESGGMPEHQVYTYGEDAENLIHFSLAKKMDKEEEEEE